MRRIIKITAVSLALFTAYIDIGSVLLNQYAIVLPGFWHTGTIWERMNLSGSLVMFNGAVLLLCSVCLLLKKTGDTTDASRQQQ